MFIVAEVNDGIISRVYTELSWEMAVKRAICLVDNILQENDQDPVDIADIEESLEEAAYFEIDSLYSVQIVQSDN